MSATPIGLEPTTVPAVDPIPNLPDPDNPSPGPDESVFPKPGQQSAIPSSIPIPDRAIAIVG